MRLVNPIDCFVVAIAHGWREETSSQPAIGYGNGGDYDKGSGRKETRYVPALDDRVSL